MSTVDLSKRNWAFKDHTGKVFGKLTVIEFSEVRDNKAYWICKCECGNVKEVAGRHLCDGQTKSCGCGRKPHGGAWKTPEYKTWKGMNQRCVQPSGAYYHIYGGRGICVCRRWMESFRSFFEDMGPRPSPSHSIDRIDNDGNYSCGKCEECLRNGWSMNCRWATPKEQGENTRRAILLTHNGETHTLNEWARIIGKRSCVVWERYKKGWPAEKILSTERFTTRRQ